VGERPDKLKLAKVFMIDVGPPSKGSQRGYDGAPTVDAGVRKSALESDITLVVAHPRIVRLPIHIIIDTEEGR